MTAAPAKTTAALRMGGIEWLLLLTLSVLWGASFFFIKVMIGELPPFTTVLGRLGIAAVVLHLFLLARGDFVRFSAKTWLMFVILGLLNNVIPFVLITFSELRISSGLAAILTATVPVFTVLVAHVQTSDEKATWNRMAGVAFGFIGVAILIGPDALWGLAHADLTGELTCLLAAVAYAFGGVYSRKFKAIPPLKVAAGQVTAGTIVLIPIVVLVDQPWTLAPPSLPVWAALFGIGLLGTAIAYVLYFRAIATAGATNMSLVTFLQPISALLLGWAALSEAVSTKTFIGMAVIGLGLAAIDGRPFRRIARAFSVSAAPTAK